jgi:hypothetical protein
MESNVTMRFWVLAVLVAPALLQPQVITDPDAYAIYNALIPFSSLIRTQGAKELVIQATTRVLGPGGYECFPSGPQLTGAWEEALISLKVQNAKPNDLAWQFSVPVTYRLVSEENIMSYFTPTSRGDWSAFHADYPLAKGFIRLSAVGFDSVHQHAIVHMSHGCGGLCGESRYYFWERKPDGWKPAKLEASDCFVVS